MAAASGASWWPVPNWARRRCWGKRVMTDTPNTSEYICLHCRRTLLCRQGGHTCRSCGASYPNRDNIHIFVDSDYYWGELEESRLGVLNDKALQQGWHTAVSSFFGEDPTRYDSITNPARTNWLSIINPPQHHRALDIGCGMGVQTEALARRFRKVYALDPVWQRLRFTSIRVQQENLHNVELMQASIAKIPLGDDFLDMILMIGILEWVGEWIQDDTPRNVQLRTLRDLRRKLRPGGELLIGIENRFGYGFLSGRRRDHSGIPLTSVMPRWMADIATFLWGRKDYRHQPTQQLLKTYRTYTYSQFSYRKLLGQAGFRDIQIFFCWPGYNLPCFICPLDDRKALGRLLQDNLLGNTFPKRVKRSILTVAIRAGAIRFFAPDFLILCRR